MADTSTVPAIHKQVINTGAADGAPGLDAGTLALLQGGGGMGNMNNPLLWLITLGFLGRNGGLLGGDNTAGALAANYVGNPAILEAINSGNLSNATQFGALSKEICQSAGQISRDIVNSAVTTNNRLADGLAEIQLTQSQGFAAGSLAECQTQNLISSTAGQIQLGTVQSQNAIQQQLASCCCENRLATANLNAALNQQTSALLQAGDSNTQKILDALSSNRIADLEAQLSDAKSAVRDATILAAINNNCGSSTKVAKA